MTDRDDQPPARTTADEAAAGNAEDGLSAERSTPPVTGEPEVDRALESLQGLETTPLADHNDRLARAHEQLHAALNADRSTPES